MSPGNDGVTGRSTHSYGASGRKISVGAESALARPRQAWHYATVTGVPVLAAAYAFGLVRNHPYRDGNKRIGFLAMATFLGGQQLHGRRHRRGRRDAVCRARSRPGVRGNPTTWNRERSKPPQSIDSASVLAYC